MRDSFRALVAPLAPTLLGFLILAGSAAATAPVWAQDPQDPAPEEAEPAPAEAPEPTAEAQAAPAPVPTPAEIKQKEKEARIAAYLRKKEEKRAMQEAERLAREQQADLALELEKQQLAEAEAQAAAGAEAQAGAQATGTVPEAAAAPLVLDRPPQIPKLPSAVVKAQAAVRQTNLGKNPTIRAYQDLIDQRQASVQQVAAFANFLAENGMNRAALVYYEFALSIEKKDPVLWVNAGTLRRQNGDLSEASQAYQRALSISPANALAHYNLGAVLDEQGRYERAIEEYRIALTLDPALGDPAINPQAAHNPRLLAVKTLLYQEQIGSLGLPLVEITTGDLEAAPDDLE